MRKAMILVCVTAIVAGAATAKDKKNEHARPEMFQKLIDCRAITDNAQRLACYDAQVANLENAEQNRELVLMDKKQVEETQRSKFGYDFDLPDAFKTADGVDLEEIEVTIASGDSIGGNNVAFTLEDGARWEQTDGKTLALSPKKGQKVKIKKAAMGSYIARINGQPGIKVKRVR